MGVSDVQDGPREGVLRDRDGVPASGENRSVVVDVRDGDDDLGGAVDRRRVGVGLENQQDVRLQLVVQRLDAADEARLGMDGEKALGVSG